MTGPSLQKHEKDLKLLEDRVEQVQNLMTMSKEEAQLQISTLTAKLDGMGEQIASLAVQVQATNEDLTKKFLDLMTVVKNQHSEATSSLNKSPPGLMAPPMAQKIERGVSTEIESVMGPQNEKRFCLSNGGCIFLVISVSVKTTSEEFQNLSLPEDYVPNIKINPITLNVNVRSSIVSVGSMVYSIGGGKLDERKTYIPTTEVTKFDTDQPNLKLESCCNMIVPRVSPAVVAIDGKIYVFGGFSPIKQTFKDSPWAECLDTINPYISKNGRH